MRNESVILPPYNYSDPGGTALGSAGMQKHALLKTMPPAHGTVHIVFLYMDGRQEHCRLEKRRRKFNKDPGIESHVAEYADLIGIRASNDVFCWPVADGWAMCDLGLRPTPLLSKGN